MKTAATIGAATLIRVRMEFLEMPGLALTPLQAQRLFGLDATVCAIVLHELIHEGFLRVKQGRYCRSQVAA